jgi:hypothetical protein
MNDDTGVRRRLRRIRSPGTRLLAITAAAALLMAACSGGSVSSPVSAGSATSSSSTAASGSDTSAAAGRSSTYNKAVAYAQCMRAHGVPNFPDPFPNGGFGISASVTGGTDGRVSSRYQAAENACASLSPAGVLSPQRQQHALNQLLKLSACMRSHGLKNFPDPSFGTDGIALHIIGFDRNSPQFQNAWRACLSQIGAGGGA